LPRRQLQVEDRITGSPAAVSGSGWFGRNIPERLGNFHHRTRARFWKFPPCLLKVINDLLNDFPKLLVNLDRIVTVNSGD
jgi:hypothetical protein